MEASDNLNQMRSFEVATSDDSIRLMDENLSVSSHTLEFKRNRGEDGLPGKIISNPPLLSPEAVSVHANTSDVAKFIQEVLQHEWKSSTVEGRARYVSNIHLSRDGTSQEHRESVWVDTYEQAFFGQFYVDNKITCYADQIDVVAHEFFHYITYDTSQLRYIRQSAALAESYSDIFGILIKNRYKNVENWDWQIGNSLGKDGGALRDLGEPSINIAKHMSELIEGNTHHNSGVHSKAAYHLIQDLLKIDSDSNHAVFNIDSIALIFYRALGDLGETATFRDSGKQLQSSARDVFFSDEERRERVIESIGTAFDLVGIMLEKGRSLSP